LAAHPSTRPRGVQPRLFLTTLLRAKVRAAVVGPRAALVGV